MLATSLRACARSVGRRQLSTFGAALQATPREPAPLDALWTRSRARDLATDVLETADGAGGSAEAVALRQRRVAALRRRPEHVHDPPLRRVRSASERVRPVLAGLPGRQRVPRARSRAHPARRLGASGAGLGARRLDAATRRGAAAALPRAGAPFPVGPGVIRRRRAATPIESVSRVVWHTAAGGGGRLCVACAYVYFR